VKTIEELALRYLPPKVSAQLQDLKQRLPTRLTQSPPVVQMFINDGQTRSFVGMQNFYSCLLPEVATTADVELRFYAPDGKQVGRATRTLAHFAAEAVDVSAVVPQRVPHGVVTAQITPHAPRKKIYRDLGLVSAHFFMFFRDGVTGCVEQTHPLSTTDDANKPSPPFTSSQIISTDKLRKLVVFQYNPGPLQHALEHSLTNLETGERVASQRHTIPALGAARSELVIEGGMPPHLLFHVDALPAANAKPMLRRMFDGGRHSMSHA
jgi:hypothetical protein